MKRDLDSGWDLIENDPALRQELVSIEQLARSDEEMVTHLIDFFVRIEGLMKLTAALCEIEAVS